MFVLISWVSEHLFLHTGGKNINVKQIPTLVQEAKLQDPPGQKGAAKEPSGCSVVFGFVSDSWSWGNCSYSNFHPFHSAFSTLPELQLIQGREEMGLIAQSRLGNTAQAYLKHCPLPPSEIPTKSLFSDPSLET